MIRSSNREEGEPGVRTPHYSSIKVLLSRAGFILARYSCEDVCGEPDNWGVGGCGGGYDVVVKLSLLSISGMKY